MCLKILRPQLFKSGYSDPLAELMQPVDVASVVNDRPWYYALIPHDAIDASATFSSFVSGYRFQARKLN